MLCQAGLFTWLAKTLMEKAQEAAAQENTRLVLLATEAMEQIASKSVKEKIEAERIRKEYDVRLEMYRDAVAQEVAGRKKKQQAERPEPRMVVTDTGAIVDANEIDWMD
jgi:hypothetical protein